jgi:competence protein ComFC
MSWLDILFPRKCVGCGKEGGYVCKECEVGMWEEEQICPACARPSRYGLRHEYCRDKTMEGLICLWAYEGIVRKLIKGSKYNNYYFDYLKDDALHNWRIAQRPELTYFCRYLELKPIVVPVPLYAKREKERGFNQAEIISLSLSKSLSLPMEKLLVRLKDTGRQVGRTREQRLKVMEGAFTVNYKSQITNYKNILLVDDVWTTGATMRECARVLKNAGARQVGGLVLAR